MIPTSDSLRRRPLPGVLLVDKPAGITSHDVVARVRRAVGVRRVGHTGTLDPFATGLMLLCVGSATRIAQYLTGLDKRYRAVIRLGTSTTTDDIEGEVLTRSDDWRDVSEEQVEAAMAGMVGRIEQTPPTYSAKKIQGRRAYQRAREGDPPVLTPVPVTVHGITIQEISGTDVRAEIHCSSGTYIRALARDLGLALGVGSASG